MAAIAAWAWGLVLDVGAGQQTIEQFLPAGTRYVSLDYWETAVGWYHTLPHIFGDGQRLPIATASIDTVLLLDVLEHLPRPGDCLAEIHRVLKPGGRLVLQVPYLYPPHDEPYDFRRWTVHGLQQLAKEHGFSVVDETLNGRSAETAALLANLALAHTALHWLASKRPQMLLLPLVPPLILLINLLGWLGGLLGGSDGWMAHGCRVVWEKQA
ncbi:MAG: hypothetical protein Kow0080_03450 [Candidatus Promineifilaceae bacterium]